MQASSTTAPPPVKPDGAGKYSSHLNNTSCLTLCVLASGSRGNATYVSDGTTSLLVDAGLSGVEIERRLASRGLDPGNLDALVVSHEHTDHIQGVGVLSRRYHLPVYINTDTHRSAKQMGTVRDVRPFECGKSFRINDLTIHPFSISHDAVDPAGFTIRRQQSKIGIATDLGIVTAMVKEHLKDCGLLVLEANHDPVMLEEGPYPWPLKQRVKSRHGHLANGDTHTLLREIRHEGLDHVVLAHLSETNNTPEKAYQQVSPALNGTRAQLHVAAQNTCTDILVI